MPLTFIRNPLFNAIIFAGMTLSATALQAQDNTSNPDDTLDELEEIIVTGSRIVRKGLTSTSPVHSTSKQQIRMDRAVTVEDIASKLPQTASGANSTGATVGDSLGSSTIDLRGLGQNRTLVLINGTRAVPFSFRNSVDVNAIPAGLINRVDVLTGGAAAVYGADAVAGVVNFIMDDDFEGFDISVGGEFPDGGAEQYNVDLTFGTDIHDGRGHVTGYVGYSRREELLAGERSFTRNSETLIPGEGGNFTDVASGNFFSFDDAGNQQSDRQTVNITPQRYLIQPLDRSSGGLFFNYGLMEDKLEVYGRATFSQMENTGAGSTGQTPVSINEEVTITSDNPYLTAEQASLLTFDSNGEAQVNVERNLGFGLQETRTDRNTYQYQLGLRGDITENISWDLYGQYGRTDGTAVVINNGIRNDGSGNSRFADIANSLNIFGPDTDLSSLSNDIIHSKRQREQSVAAITLSGDSSDWFQLPAGPVGFAVGYELREEDGSQTPGTALALNLAYGLGGIGDLNDGFTSKEFYSEILVPIISDLPLVQELSLEGAYRVADYTNTDVGDTYKYGLSWTVNDDIRVRATRTTSVRAPNLGEFAGPEVQLTLALFDPDSASFIPRLGGRFDGDPCLDGRGDAAQCERLGAAAPGTSFDTSAAIYSFGGNADIKPEESEATTLGIVYTPNYLSGLSITLDYYDIEITDAVSQIQPISALTNCYIDNPSAGNPLCGAVLRDPTTGLISQALVNDFNLASLQQKGYDLGVVYSFDAPDGMGESFKISYQGNKVTDQTRQNNATVDAIDCKGTFGTSCTGDFASILQADYRHRATLDWFFADSWNLQLSWRRIGEVENVLDRSDKIDAQDYLDLAAIWNVNTQLQISFGVDNLSDETPPLPNSSGNLYGTVSEYDVMGITGGVSARWHF